MSSSEQAFFFGPPGGRLYAMLHAPAAGKETEGAWIVCAPYGEECGFARQLLVEWARALSAEGFWVMRFDYRGHGDSSGEFEQFTAEDLVDDISAAAAELERRAGVQCTGLCGLRLGATLAAVAAGRGKSDPLLVLWEPIVRGERYVNDMLRSVVASRQPGETTRTREQLKQRMATGEPVFLRGRGLTAAICESIASLDLPSIGRPTTSPVLIVQTAAARGEAPRRALVELQACYARTAPADLSVVVTPPLWDGRLEKEHEARVRPADLFGTTLAWVREHAPRGRSATTTRLIGAETAAARPAPAGGAEERTVSFTVAGAEVRGILHVPARLDTARPSVVIPPHGISRGGFNRLYVKLARRLAQQGWPVLRFDARGMGESGGRAVFTTGVDLFLAVENGLHVDDTTAAIDFMMREVGARSVILAGACGGGITSVLVAARDERVPGAVFLEASLRYYAEAKTAEAPPLWMYRRKVFSARSWRRLLSFQIDFPTQWRWARQRLLGALRVKEDVRTATIRNTLGPRANLGLINAFRTCIERGKPVLCLFGETDNALYFKASSEHLGLQAGPSGVLSSYVIAGADHNFSMPQHAGEAFRRISDWLAAAQQPWMTEA